MPQQPTLLHKQHPPDKLFEIGKQLYRQRRFPDAIDAFNAVAKSDEYVDKKGRLNVDLLDYRAAANSKLNKHKAALADARDMIENEEALPVGYLRIGRVLQDMEKPARALQFYQRGLKFCKPGSPKYDLLVKEKQKLDDVRSAVDFLPVLPVEIVHHIFDLLPFKSKLILLKVCKSWRTRLSQSPTLWTHLDYSETRKPVRPTDVEIAMGYARGRARRFTLKGLPLQGLRLLELMMKSNPGLEALALLSGGSLDRALQNALSTAKNLRSLHLAGRITLTQSAAGAILRSCPHLTEYELRSVLVANDNDRTMSPAAAPELQLLTIDLTDLSLRVFDPSKFITVPRTLISLRVTHSVLQSMMNFDQTLEQATRLQRLHLSGHYRQLENEPRILKLSRNLQSLTLHNTALFAPSFAELEHDALRMWQEQHRGEVFLDQLKELRVRENSSETFHALTCAVLSAGRDGTTTAMLDVLELTLSAYRPEDLPELLALMRLKELKRLALVRCYVLDDAAAQTIAESFKQLRELDLTQTSLTGVGVKALVLGLPRLHSLCLVDCARVGPDAVDWARGRGVSVEFGQRQASQAHARSWTASRMH